MAHIDINEKADKLKSLPDWLPIGKQVGDLANKWADRQDIIAILGEKAGGGSPACFVVPRAEVEVNTRIAFGEDIEPSDITDLRKRKDQYEYPKAIGAIYHESFHARFTRFSMPEAYKKLNRDEYDALMLLEEARIENFGMKALPRSRTFLRSMVIDIVIDDLMDNADKLTGTKVLANLVALVVSRVNIETIDASEVQPILDKLNAELGVSKIEHLSAIAQKFYSHKVHNDATKLYGYAREWVEAVQEIAEERGDADPTEEEKQALAEALSEMLSEFGEMLEEAGAKISIDNFNELVDQEQQEVFAEINEEKGKEAKEREQNKDIATKIFDHNSRVTTDKTRSKLVETREPSSKERSASVYISRMLDKAKYRERDHTVVASSTPPGRLRSRAMIQNKALRERGQQPKELPFRKNVFKHTEEPTLSVGVMVDISGSMRSAMEPMASSAWIMAEATRRIQGKCAMVYYGQSVFPTLRMGEHLDKVRVYSASDSTEEFAIAFKALDGALNLQYGRGARLLVIVSDGHYREDMVPQAQDIVAKCKKAGVAILWLPFDDGSGARAILDNYGEVVTDFDSPEEAPMIIGTACKRILEKVGQRQIA